MADVISEEMQDEVYEGVSQLVERVSHRAKAEGVSIHVVLILIAAVCRHFVSCMVRDDLMDRIAVKRFDNWHRRLSEDLDEQRSAA